MSDFRVRFRIKLGQLENIIIFFSKLAGNAKSDLRVNKPLQDKIWAEFSTLEVAICMPYHKH
jgi:hypothetical protein